LSPSVSDVQRAVAESADISGDHATAPALLLELQAQLGGLCALASEATEGGRRPFRVPAEWPALMGEFAYGLYLLADQTGVDADDLARAVAAVKRTYVERPRTPDINWPFTPA